MVSQSLCTLGTMGKIQLWTGLPGSGRRNEAESLAVSSSRAGHAVWWVSGSMRAAESVESALITLAEGALANVEIAVTGQLPRHLLRSAGIEVETLPVEVREMVLRELLAPEFGESGLPGEATDGWVRRVAEFYARLEQGDIQLEKLLHKRYPWITRTLDRYKKRIADSGLIDEAALPGIAMEHLRAGKLSPINLLIVDRLGSLQPHQEELLKTLSGWAFTTIILVDDVEGAGPALQESCQQANLWTSLPDVSVREFSVDESRTELARSLFVRADPANDGLLPNFGNVHCGYYADRTAEVRAAAKTLSRLVHSEGYEAADILVVCSKLEDYEEHVREFFPRWGLLPDIRLGSRMDANPVARAVLSLFELRSAGLSRERITDLLLNPYVRWGTTLSRDEGVLSLDSYARKAGIREGHGNFENAWKSPLLELIEKIRARAAHIDEGETEDIGGDVRARAALREAERVQRALRELESFAKLLFSLPDTCSAIEAIGWLDTLLDKLGINDSVNRTARSSPRIAGEDIRALGHLKLTLRHVLASFDIHGRERWPVSRFSEVLKFALSQVRLSPTSRLRGGIPVVGPLDLRGQRVRELIFLGMTAEAWPRSPELDIADPFGTKWMLVDRLAESRSLTLEALLAAERVTFSVPCPKSGGSSGAPSPLLGEIEAAGIVMQEVSGEKEDQTLRSLLESLPELGRTVERSTVDGETLANAMNLESLGLKKDDVLHRVNVEMWRNDPETLTPYEGYLSERGTVGLLTELSLASPLSATRLDSYAKCPMKFFLGDVLKVAPLEEVEEDLDPRQLGGMVHEILARSMERLTTLRGGPPDIAENVEQVSQVMFEEVETAMNQLGLDNAYGDRLRKRISSGLINPSEPPGYLKRLLNDHEKRLSGEKVLRVEAAFGLPAEEGKHPLLVDPITIKHGDAEVKLAGRIDRIDYKSGKGWRVWDYKVSKNDSPSKGKILNGLSFQLPVYLWALREWLEQSGEADKTIDYAGFYTMKPEAAPIHTKGWTGKLDVESGDDVRGFVVAIQEAIRSGRFHHPLEQNDKLCADSDYNYCPFKQVCRRDHTLFRQRPERLQKEFLKSAYKLPFQSFAADEEDGDA